MTEFIILSRGDIMTLCKDEPVKVRIDERPMLICSDEYFEKQKKEDKNKVLQLINSALEK